MGRSISLEDAQRSLVELIERMPEACDEPISIKVDDETVALLVDSHYFKLLQRLWDRHVAALRDTQEYNADVDSDEIYREVTRATEEVRQEQHERRNAAVTRLE